MVRSVATAAGSGPVALISPVVVAVMVAISTVPMAALAGAATRTSNGRLPPAIKGIGKGPELLLSATTVSVPTSTMPLLLVS